MNGDGAIIRGIDCGIYDTAGKGGLFIGDGCGGVIFLGKPNL